MNPTHYICRESFETTMTSDYPVIESTNIQQLRSDEDRLITFVVNPEHRTPSTTPGFISPNELASMYEEKWGKEKLVEARKNFAQEIYGSNHSLSSIRMGSGLSQRDLSQITGLTQAHIAKIESGQTEPGRAVMNKLCLALKIDMNTLNEALS